MTSGALKRGLGATALLVALPVAKVLARERAPAPPTALANDNTVPAGARHGDTVEIRLVAQPALWRPEEDQTPPMAVEAFGEEGKLPTIPAPLIRVRGGTHLRVIVRNALDTATLIIHGLASRPQPRPDSLAVPAGASDTVSFDAGAPGTYMYWATTTKPPTLEDRAGPDAQLSGAFVVDDSAGSPPDRVFVITAGYQPPDPSDLKATPERIVFVLNGRSWPHTERLSFTVGDSVRWRIVNASAEPHPLHLHGFFFRVDHRGSDRVDSTIAPDARMMVVTQVVPIMGTAQFAWSPTRPGQWLFHCHLQAHISPDIMLPTATGFLRDVGPVTHALPGHSVHEMAGLVLGLTVRPRPGAPETPFVAARHIRLVLEPGLGRPHSGAPGVAVRISGAVAPPPRTTGVAGPPLVLVRNEPVEITVVNHLTSATTIHWHGIELGSYFDGVPFWSGSGQHLAPQIAAGDSFVVHFAPPRSGTFIYHAHTSDGEQVTRGLYGALIVLDPGARFDPSHDIPLVFAGRDVNPRWPPMLNGSSTPPPLELHAGERYRLRLVNILEDDSVALRLSAGSSLAQWRLLAKDGATLPPALTGSRAAALMIQVGETYDAELVPVRGQALRLTEGPQGEETLTLEMPVR
ncbi:MAG TPA: multicopper oxidase domain-containing protein [Gemmatimonadaceae bacterium]|nr:multicopper oxidase domain-containing protein [Gemmatimonadaceae bacterium]